MKILKSVGCAISDNGITYAINDDGTVDKSSNVHLDDCIGLWYDELSPEDKQIVLEIEKEL